MRWIVVAMVASGCGAVQWDPAVTMDSYSDPGFLDSHAELEAIEVPAPPAADAALRFVLDSYVAQTGLTMPTVHVRWVSEWFTPPGQKPRADGQLATGITYACDDIWVWTSPTVPVGGTALAHEIGHCAHAVASGGDADPAHADPAWWDVDGFANLAILSLQASGL